MQAHFASDTGLKARLRSATRSPRIPFRHSKPGQIPLTYDLPIPRHTAAGIFGLGALDRSIPRHKSLDLQLNRIAVPIQRENSVDLRRRVPVRRAQVPMTRKVPAAPGAFFPGMGMMEMGMGGLGAYPSPYGRPAPGTQWMNKHGHRRYQVDGLGGWFKSLFRRPHSAPSSGGYRGPAPEPLDSAPANMTLCKDDMRAVKAWALQRPRIDTGTPWTAEGFQIAYDTWQKAMPKVLAVYSLPPYLQGLGEDGDSDDEGMWSFNGMGAFTAHKLRVRPPRVLGKPRTRKVGLVPAMGHARNFIPGLGEEDAGDTLEMGSLNADELAADASPNVAAQAASAGAGAMKNMMLVAAGAFALGMWLRSR